MPQVRKLFKDLMGREPYVEIHPDEVVAMGAAVQAGILTGQIQGKILIEVTPISLGIETQGGIFTKIIEKNTTIPTSEGHLFTNAADDQTSMDIHVLQGERPLAPYNMTLDRFEMTGIPPLPRGEAWIEVKFDINADGILVVSAKDLHTENCKRLRITPRFYGLPREEIARMVEEAEKYAERDQKEHEEIEIGIKANNMIRAGQQIIEDAGENVDTYLVDEVEKGILELKDALASGESEEIKFKTDRLEEQIKALDRLNKEDRKSSYAKATEGKQRVAEVV